MWPVRGPLDLSIIYYIVGSDIQTETFIHGASGVSQRCVLELLAQEHQKHPVEIVQFIYPTRQFYTLVKSSMVAQKQVVVIIQRRVVALQLGRRQLLLKSTRAGLGLSRPWAPTRVCSTSTRGGVGLVLSLRLALEFPENSQRNVAAACGTGTRSGSPR